MSIDTRRRCRHCGGTLWRDGDVVKCFMCSRPVEGQGGVSWAPNSLSRPKLPGSPDRNGYRRAK